MIKAICLDFDGVIVESADIKTNAFAKLFESEDRETIKKIVDYHLLNNGVSRFDKFRFIYKEILNRPLTKDLFNLLCDKFSTLVIDEVVNAPYVNGAREFLLEYMKKYLYFIISATPQLEIEEIIRRKKIGGLFKAIYGAPNKKTDAVKTILTEVGYIPKEILHIGDAMSDYIAAKDNSVRFIARVYDKDIIFDNIDCIKITDLSGLSSLIRKL